MADVTVKKFEELDYYKGQGIPPRQFSYAGKSLGVSSWGMNLLNLPANWDGYPDHDHVSDGQEEVYVVLKGDATLDRGWSNLEARARDVHAGRRGAEAQDRAGIPGSDDACFGGNARQAV